MSFKFFTLPVNTSGAAIIPISHTPTPLASLTIEASPNNIAALRVNIGWIALPPGPDATKVLFKLWRGAPVTGELITSVLDSVERSFDNDATTDFSHVVTNFTANQTVTFVLTAETVEANTLAQVIGPLTFTAFVTDLAVLNFYELPNNNFGAASIPVAQAPVPIGFIIVDVKAGENVILRSSIGWLGTSQLFPKVNALFKIWRGAPITGTLVASADDSADAEGGAVTSFSHVDSGFTAAQRVVYVLTAEAPDPNHAISIMGALTFTGSVQTLGGFYVLPNNTANSVSIPITTTGTPLAALTVSTNPALHVSLRAGIGWLAPQTAGDVVTPILFKIWRGAPITGTLIYSTRDSGETAFDNRKVTSLAHVDGGFTSSQLVTYTLTAELTKPGTAANVVGPLTFTIVPEN